MNIQIPTASELSLPTQLTKYVAHLKQCYETKDFSCPEASINLADDEELLIQVQQLISKKSSPALKYIIDIGIGGSNLGTRAIYDAIHGYTDNLHPSSTPKLYFADTCDDDYIAALVDFIQTNVQAPEEILLILVSKSGSTTETIVNFEILFAALQKKFHVCGDRVIVITDQHSALWQRAEAQAFTTIAIPKEVGGRYSVLSAVGLVPLFAAGIDIVALRKGAGEMIAQCMQTEVKDNPAMQSAMVLYQSGKTIHDTFVFDPALESLGKWYRQLLGESIGKEKDIHGNIVHVGLTPTVSVGSTDLHSVGQLYLGGPNDKITTFVRVKKQNRCRVPKQLIFSGLVSDIEDVPADTIISAILQGVQNAYDQANIPYMVAELEHTTPYELGKFMQWKMCEIMYLANLLAVNAFDQPNVEAYKMATKKILAQ